jgi:hypothetical protein
VLRCVIEVILFTRFVWTAYGSFINCLKYQFNSIQQSLNEYTMMKFRIILFSAALLSSMTAVSQKNVVKINLPSAFIKNIYASYERALTDKISISLGLSYMPARGLLFANQIKSDEIDINNNDSDRLENIKMHGYSITPEIRFYTARRKEAPRGFYVAPYARYLKQSFKGDYIKSYTDDDLGPITARFDLTGEYTVLAAGVLLGYQWLISDRVSIDWTFFGLGVGKYQVNLRESSPDVGKSYYSTSGDGSFSGNFDNIPVNAEYKYTATSGEGTIKTILPHIRSGLSIGIAF